VLKRSGAPKHLELALILDPRCEHIAHALAGDMASRQVQWRRFAFFEKETLSEDLTLELGAQVTCLAAAAGNTLLLGDESGKLAVSSDSFASEQRTQRKVFQGSVQAVAAAGGLIWAVGTDAPSASELATVVKAWADTALESLVLTLNTSVHHSSPAALTAFAVGSLRLCRWHCVAVPVTASECTAAQGDSAAAAGHQAVSCRA
jgi:hypothetical protein